MPPAVGKNPRQNSEGNMRRIGFVAAIVGVLSAAIIAIVLVALSQNVEFQKNVSLEVVKYLLQLVVVITVGGGVAALFKTAEHDRDLAERARDEAARQAQLRAQV